MADKWKAVHALSSGRKMVGRFVIAYNISYGKIWFEKCFQFVHVKQVTMFIFIKIICIISKLIAEIMAFLYVSPKMNRRRLSNMK